MVEVLQGAARRSERVRARLTSEGVTDAALQDDCGSEAQARCHECAPETAFVARWAKVVRASGAKLDRSRNGEAAYGPARKYRNVDDPLSSRAVITAMDEICYANVCR